MNREDEIELASASLADALRNQSVPMIVRVPTSSFSDGYEGLHPIFNGCPDHQILMEEGGVSCAEMRRRCALFHHVASLLPMCPLEFHHWASQADEGLSGGQYTRQFVAQRVLGADGIESLMRDGRGQKVVEFSKRLSEVVAARSATA